MEKDNLYLCWIRLECVSVIVLRKPIEGWRPCFLDHSKVCILGSDGEGVCLHKAARVRVDGSIIHVYIEK